MNSVTSVLAAAILACIFVSVCAYEDYNDYLLPDEYGYYPLDKRGFDSFCAKCMSSDDWYSCYKCWDRPGRSAPYYGKKKRGYWSRPGSPVPYYVKRSEEIGDDNYFPGEYEERMEKRASIFKCKCCLMTEDYDCCLKCKDMFAQRESKRGYDTSFFDTRYNDRYRGIF